MAGRKPHKERNDAIVLLRDGQGLTFEKLGEFFGMSRQTAHEIYQREKQRQENKELSTL